ncbi:MAG: sigma-70 family RNA polymerase sigma factor [Actinomycetota bacterium]|nr:sigma-70 family RNA polymerase sigma factor [Actinomycetota bacterium]
MTGIHRPPFGGRGDEAERPVDGSPEAAAAEDLALLARLRAGEDAAFGELFSRHADAVRRFARGIVHDRAEVEDLTAEAFFRVLQAIRRGSGPVDNVRGYLLTVARRVAWEWAGRRRDVPVSDEELNHRVGADPDNTGQSTERNLITSAFTSLPERWRTVLWKVEVEGERPAVVAMNFGLSPNATAALARRARQGLRAAYLQAHLTVERGSTGCRSVLAKLGAYTAGSVKGTERRRVRAHLSTCSSCSSMYDELQDVCSGLRRYAAFIAPPMIASLALVQHVGATAAAGGVGVTVKGLLAGAKTQIALAATSAAAVGAFGLALISWGEPAGDEVAYDDLDGRPGQELVLGSSEAAAGTSAGGDSGPGRTSASDHPADDRGEARTPETDSPIDDGSGDSGKVRPGQAPGAEDVPSVARGDITGASTQQPSRGGRPTKTKTKPSSTSPAMGVFQTPTGTYDNSLPVVYQEESFEQDVVYYENHDVVRETTRSTKVNSADQTTVATRSTEYTRNKNRFGVVPDDGSMSTPMTARAS